MSLDLLSLVWKSCVLIFTGKGSASGGGLGLVLLCSRSVIVEEDDVGNFIWPTSTTSLAGKCTLLSDISTAVRFHRYITSTRMIL